MRETSQPTFHDFGGHESQADCHDRSRVRQQREGLRIVHVGMNEELDVITESMDLLQGQTSAFALRRMEAMAVSASPEGLTTVTDALSAKARKPLPGLEGVKFLPSGSWIAAVTRCGIPLGAGRHPTRQAWRAQH